MDSPVAITSAANPLLKEIRKAGQSGGLTADGLAVCETLRLLADVLPGPARVEAVLSAEERLAEVDRLLAGHPGVRLLVAPGPLVASVANVEVSQGVIALVRPREWSMADVLADASLVVVLDGVQDPGNGGAMLRLAEAFGATGVVALKGTVNLFNPKAIRASAGSVFRVPVMAGLEPAALLDQLGQVTCFAALPEAGAAAVDAVDWTAPAAFVIGNEGRGVSNAMRARAKAVTIPTQGVESLNASTAAAVILYEAARQRRAKASR